MAEEKSELPCVNIDNNKIEVGDHNYEGTMLMENEDIDVEIDTDQDVDVGDNSPENSVEDEYIQVCDDDEEVIYKWFMIILHIKRIIFRLFMMQQMT